MIFLLDFFLGGLKVYRRTRGGIWTKDIYGKTSTGWNRDYKPINKLAHEILIAQRRRVVEDYTKKEKWEGLVEV